MVDTKKKMKTCGWRWTTDNKEGEEITHKWQNQEEDEDLRMAVDRRR